MTMTTKPLTAQDLRQRAEELFRASESLILETTTHDETKQLLHELRVHQIELEIQNEELRRAQEELDVSQARYFDLYDLAPVGYLTITDNNMIQEVNLAAATMFGVARSLLVNEGIRKILPKESQLIFYQYLKQCIEANSAQEWEMRLLRADGEQFWAHLQVTPGQNGECWLIINDISARKYAEEAKLILEQQLQQAQKLESLGVLAGGIAHDFNNILCVIMSNCSLAKLRPHMAGEFLPEIDKAAQRAADLCRQMLNYAGKSSLTFTQVKMTALVDDMIKMLKATINKNVTITSNFSADIPSIRGDASQLRQIVMNLIINASEAIGEEHGDIRVSLAETTVVEGKSDKDHIGKSIPVGQYVCLEVADNGCGMDDDTRQRVFEPFYTTKFTGRGLGMSAVLGIITSHKGALQFTSQQGSGTTFKVYLPVQNGEPTGDSLAHFSLVSWQGSGTILLVEDEPQLSMVAKALMQALGFSVIEAVNGKEALELYQKNAEYITLVVTDIGMPIMDGYELFRKLKDIVPELPIIISSGFGDTLVSSRIATGEAAGFLSKPYSFDNLREVLKSVVEGRQKIV